MDPTGILIFLALSLIIAIPLLVVGCSQDELEKWYETEQTEARLARARSLRQAGRRENWSDRDPRDEEAS